LHQHVPQWMQWSALALAVPLVIWGVIGFWRGLSLKPNDPKTRVRRSRAGALLGMPWW
jgi:hypothetical protein